MFSVQMLKASRDVVAFEPRVKQAADLTAMFDAVRVPVRVEAVALSDRRGISNMRILTADPGRSTIENANPLDDEDGSPRAEIAVRVRRLDDYAFDAVGFIKIDVEGHELAVLNGAGATIERSKPTLLIELEDRHRPNAVADATTFLQSLGYGGYLLLDDEIYSVDQFDPDIHQKRTNICGWTEGWSRRGVYVNSFVFLPGDVLNATISMALMTDTSLVGFAKILQGTTRGSGSVHFGGMEGWS
jgi:FkbM family methyltransferase